MRKRADQMNQTRQRIVHAAVHLHGTLGPAATSVAGIARAAGVTRLTVYRHFPDEQSLYAACSAHWLSRQHLPNAATWAEIADPIERLQCGLADLYRFYRDGAAMLTRIYRDKDALPAMHRQGIEQRDRHLRDVLIEPFETMTDPRQVRAIVAHAASFWTWRSLCVEHGLSESEAVDAISALALAMAPRGDDPDSAFRGPGSR
jgi:AcrR family transcriptional regulator